jgi:alanyl-tRNA synthetase
MNRKEAEEKFGNDIYDKFPVPSHIRTLTLTMIKDWNINCCLGPHHSSTGEIPPISIRKWRYRDSKSELEISFELG